MNKLVKFHFELEDKSPLILTYKLHPNSLTAKWTNIINRRSSNNTGLELKITNKTSADLEKLMIKLNSIVTDINKYYDHPLPLFTTTNEIDQNILNYLHEEFERYGERHSIISGKYRELVGDPNVWPGNSFNSNFHQLWLDLNQWIHITESAMHSTNFPNFSCLIQYTPFEEQGAAITDEDGLFLDSTFSWGRLYLGYNTLGKDYMHAFYDDDKRVIINNQIKVQEWMSSEVWLNFNPDVNLDHKAFELLFWKWFKTLPNTPPLNLNELRLGRYYLGELIFDQTFLDFHPNYNDWLLVDNRELRKKWNTEVFSKIVKATGIKIV
jgi:hypothetical protein